MEKFPQLAAGQVAVIRAESETGHILDESLKLVVSENQKVYTVLNDYEEALSLVYSIMEASKGKVECVIYNEQQEVLKYLSS